MLQLETNLDNPESLKQTLEELIDFISIPERLHKHLAEYTFIYPSFGTKVDGDFKEFEENTEKLREEEQIEFDTQGKNYCFELPYFTSETLFFRKAASYTELHSLILQYIDLLIKHSKEEGLLWSHDETPAGTDAIESLAFIDSKYIQKYIEFLRINDMDHEVNQHYGIGLIIKNHGWNEDTLHLIAVRLGECCGQHGDQNLELLLESTELADYLKDERHSDIFLKHLTDEFKLLLKKHNNNDDIRATYPAIYEKLFEGFPAILKEVDRMKTIGV